MSDLMNKVFQDLAQQITTRIDPKSTDYDIYVGLEHLDSDTLRIKRRGTPADVEGEKLLVQKGDIIFGKRRVYQRKVGIADFDGICSAHAMVLRAKEDTIIKQLFPFFMQSDQFMNRALQISVGSLSPTINWKTLAKQEFSVPNTTEQKKISSFLWAVEDCIIRNEQFIEAAKKAKQVLTQELFIQKKNSLKEKVEFSKLGNEDYFKLMTGGTPSTKKSEYWNGNIPWLLSGEVNKKRINNTEKRITELGYQNSNATIIPKYSVLIALAGQGKTRGTVAITEIELTTNQSVAAIVVNPDKIDPFYIFYLLESMYEDLRRYSGMADRGGLSLRSLKRICLPIPQIDEQKQIANILTKCDNTITSAQMNLTAAKALKMKLINQFFSGGNT